MSVIEQLGVALGLATLAGLNLYLTVFIAGLAIRFQWVDLAVAHDGLAVLAEPWVIGVAGVMFVIEFFADKVPWVDSAWDATHTVIRPAGGVMLSLAALGDLNPALVVIATLFAGTTALASHSTKAGVRALVNLSPEPVSNSVASVTEDGLVLGGLGLIALAPTVAFFVFLVVAALFCAFAIFLWKRIFRMRASRKKAGLEAVGHA